MTFDLFSSAPDDAVELLKEDHRKVEALFEEFEEAEGKPEEKERIVAKILSELTYHTMLEEELFYPAVREAVPEAEELVNEAEVEHDGAKELMAEIEGMSADDDLYDARVKVLKEQIEHHVEEEEGEMFPKVKSSSLDLKTLFVMMKKRKQELMAGDTVEEEKVAEEA